MISILAWKLRPPWEHSHPIHMTKTPSLDHFPGGKTSVLQVLSKSVRTFVEVLLHCSLTWRCACVHGFPGVASECFHTISNDPFDQTPGEEKNKMDSLFPRIGENLWDDKPRWGQRLFAKLIAQDCLETILTLYRTCLASTEMRLTVVRVRNACNATLQDTGSVQRMTELYPSK